MAWDLVELGEVVSIKGGGTPDKSIAEYWNGNIPWASVKDFKSNYILSTIDSITELGVANSATNIIPKDTIIIPTRMGVGKAAINKIDLAINQDLKALKPNNKININFLLYCLLFFASKLEQQASGATVKGITLDIVKALKIPLPPLPEQIRIAAFLNKATGVIEARKSTLKTIDALKASLFIEMFGNPVTNPMGWEVKKLGEICDINPRLLKKLDNEQVSVVPMAYVSANGSMLVEKTSPYSEIQKGLTYFEKNDILVAKITPCYENNKSCIVDMHTTYGFGSTEFHVFRCSNNQLFNVYLFNLLRFSEINKAGAKRMTGSAGQRRVPKAFFESLQIPLPPLALQAAFAEKITALNILKAKHTEHLEQLTALFAALQHKAFRGEL